MREMKFRAWELEAKEMFEVSAISWEEAELRVWLADDQTILLPWDNRITLLQFTGLDDKNGKEIWEGDVVRTRWGGLGKIGFDDGMFCVLFEDGAVQGCLCKSEIEERGLEIIGNVYENRELLDGSQISLR